MHRCWLVTALALAVELTAVCGSIDTMDGRTLVGQISFFANALAVAGNASVTNVVPLTNLLSADFAPAKSDAASTKGDGLGWLGAYFAGRTPEAAPLVRLDESIDFNWAAGEALPGFLPEAFSVIWSGEIDPPAGGDYQFHLSTDGPATLLLDGKPAIQITAAGDFIERTSPLRKLEAGRRLPVSLAYTNSAGPARVRLTWSSRAFASQPIPRGRIYPTTMLPQQTLAVTNGSGLLGAYYSSAAFSGASLLRVDEQVNFAWQGVEPMPGFSRTNLSVRWTGRVRAEHSEEYTFHVTTDERVRLWVDDKPVIHRTDQFWLSDSKGTVPLIAGEPHAIRLEVTSTGGDAVAKLAWSSASTPRTNIPVANLSPAWPATGSAADGRAPAGVLLRNGTFIAGAVERATETSVRASGLLKPVNLTAPNVARIHFAPIPAAMEKTIPRGRAGVLLARGDFVDGDFRGFDGQRVRLNSILFGTRSYEIRKEALAVVLRDAVTNAAGYELRLRDRSVVRTDSLRLENGQWLGRDTIAGPLKLAVGEVESLRRLTKLR